MNRENRSEQIDPTKIEKRLQELDQKLIEGKGDINEDMQIIDETAGLLIDKSLAEEAERLNKIKLKNQINKNKTN